MNERERILDLVKQGVLSSEEGLVLLENLAQQGKTTTTKTTTETDTPEADTAANTAETTAEDDDQLNQRAKWQSELETVTRQITDLRQQLAANDEQIIVYDTMEDLDTLTPDKASARTELKTQNRSINTELSQLEDKRATLKTNLVNLDRRLRQKDIKSSFENVLPDDWQDQAKSAAADLGRAVMDAGSQIGAIVKQKTKSVMDNVDWKDVTVRVPGIATQKFSHVFTFPSSTATVLDVNVASGRVKFDTWQGTDIQVAADVRFFGKVDGDLLTAFTDRSRIEADADRFVFQVPNKRVEANLVISLPERDYDHVTVRNLNGDVIFNHIVGKDFFVKLTNGDLKVSGGRAVMLEAENVNGNLQLVDAEADTVVLSTMNGDIRFAGVSRSLKLSTVNGDVKLTMTAPAKGLTATSVNGNVKLALPETSGVTGQIKTRFGKIRSRMTGVSTPGAQHRTLDLARPGEDTTVVTLSTVAGDLLLKDTDKER